MFDPTEKQLAALANMESYVGVNSNRTQFKDQPEFQDYWNLVSKRCDKVSRHKKSKNPAVSATASPEQIQKRNESKISYYNDEKNLKSYAQKYCQRYQPSRNKLCAQLMRKSHNQKLSDLVTQQLSEYMDDDALALQLTERMRDQGKNKNYITNKLSQRLFEQDCINRCIKTTSTDTGSIWDTDALRKKVETLKRKGFSLHAIRQKLTEQQADKPLVEEALSAVFSTVTDDHNLRSAIAKMQSKNIEHEKIIKRLISKGFRYAAIKELLNQESK